jgi:hypothetical protein
VLGRADVGAPVPVCPGVVATLGCVLGSSLFASTTSTMVTAPAASSTTTATRTGTHQRLWRPPAGAAGYCCSGGSGPWYGGCWSGGA